VALILEQIRIVRSRSHSRHITDFKHFSIVLPIELISHVNFSFLLCLHISNKFSQIHKTITNKFRYSNLDKTTSVGSTSVKYNNNDIIYCCGTYISCRRSSYVSYYIFTSFLLSGILFLRSKTSLTGISYI
jgi:hypothetical protein